MKVEYKILQLKEQPGHVHRVFAWESQCGCHRCAPEELGALLNRLGAEGWHAAVLGASDRNPHSLILSRQVLDEAPEPQTVLPSPRPPKPRPAPLAAPDPQFAVLTEEIRALRAQLTTLPAPQVTVQPTPVHVAPTVNFEALVPQFEALLTSVRSLKLGQEEEAAALRRTLDLYLEPRLVPAHAFNLEATPPAASWWHMLFRRLGLAGGAS